MMYIRVSYVVTAINHATKSSVHIFDIQFNRCGYHTENIPHTATMLHGCIHLKFLHIHVKKQPAARSTLIIAQYVPETIMPTNLGIYAKY